jgi:ABC-2 type transport system ATP-binding protein
MHPSPDPLIEIQRLTKHFGAIAAVDGVSFDVAANTVLGLLGPNGAGKSTTMKMLTGYLRPTSGTARVCGRDVRTHPLEVKASLGYLPEGAPAYPDMTPAGFLRFVAAVRGFRGRARTKRVEVAAERAGLRGVMRQPIETLSKGYKRRVGLAQAILHEPPVLVLDEPTDGLDPNQKHEVRRLIASLAEGRAIVLCTHILEEVESVCTRAMVIARGRVVADGTPDELRARSARHNAVTLAVRADADDVITALTLLEDVRRVERLSSADSVARVVVTPEGGRPVSAAVAETCRERGWSIEELAVAEGRLDEVFRDLTAGTKKSAASEPVEVGVSA